MVTPQAKSVVRRGARSRDGFGLTEMVIAMVLGLFVVLALGHIVLVNKDAWGWTQDKAVLQQNVTETLEWMARSVRAARRVEMASSTEFRTFDETGALVHSYQLVETTGGGHRLQEDGRDLSDRLCTQFVCTPGPDTTSLILELELEDKAEDRVAGMTRATMRNRNFLF